MDETIAEARKNGVKPTWGRLCEIARVSLPTSHRASPHVKEEWKRKLEDPGKPPASVTAKAKKVGPHSSENIPQLRQHIAIMASHIQALSLLVRKLEAELAERDRRLESLEVA